MIPIYIVRLIIDKHKRPKKDEKNFSITKSFHFYL